MKRRHSDERTTVAFLGFGKGEADDAVQRVKETATALEQAKQPQQDTGAFGNAVTRMIENLLDIGIDGRGPLDSAQQVADQARAKHPVGDEAVDSVVRSHLRVGAIGGFVTSLGGFITMPVSLPANVLEFYIVATRMVAGIAALRGYDLRQPQIRSAVLLTLVGADSDDLLKKAGVVATGRFVNLAAQRLPGPALMVVNRAVVFRLLTQTGRKTLSRLGKGVPIAGGFIGAGLDTFLLKRIADQARREFPPTVAGV